MSSRNYVSPELIPGKYRIPIDFKLIPDLAGLAPGQFSLPVTPTVPPLVATGDLITSIHENAVRAAIADLWTDVQYLEGNKLADTTLTAKGDILTRTATAAAPLPLGATGQTLQADTSTATGLKWVTVTSGAGGVTTLVNSAAIGTRAGINLAAGTNVTITGVDDAVNDRVNVTISATGGGGGGGGATLVDDTLIGTRAGINLKAGSNVTLSGVDDAANDRVNVTVNSAGDGFWAAASGGINYSGGNVGIGTTSPTAHLHVVAGGARFGSGAYSEQNGDVGISRESAPTSAVVYFGDGTHYLYFDGATFQLRGNLNLINAGSTYSVNSVPVSGGGVATQTAYANGSGASQRQIGTIYQNTLTKPLMVTVSIGVNTVGAVLSVYTDTAANPTTLVAEFQSPASLYPIPMSFWVLPGSFYKILVSSGTTFFLAWVEWS